MEDWVNLELATIDLGDKRLDKRAKTMLSKFSYAPGKTIPQTFEVWGEIKACYRFFENKHTSPEKVLAPHFKKTSERIREYPVVLLANDTSDIDYTSKAAMKNKQRLSNKREGFWIHPMIAITQERLNLGMVDLNLFSRDEKSREENGTHRDELTIEEKESYRWLQSYQKACQVAVDCPKTQIVYMSDREGDIGELIENAIEAKKNGPSADIIIRSQHDRKLDEKDPESTKYRQYKKLRKTLASKPSKGEIRFSISTSHERKGREVIQSIKAESMTFRIEKKGMPLRKITINVVMAIEENPPEGEEPLIWTFLTTLNIDSQEDILKVIKYYLCRWEIELFFKVLKSGCKIEERQLEATEKMSVLISLFCIVSWRIMYTMMLGRLCPEISCADIFSDAEWKSVYKVLHKNSELPDKAPSLKEFILMVAALGGYVGGKKAPPPGIKIMWRGMSRMVDFAIAWEAFGG
jgi:hypothetical protein